MKSHVKVNRTVLTLSKCSVMLVPSFTGRAKRVGPGGSMGVVLTSDGEGEGLWTDSSRRYGVGVGVRKLMLETAPSVAQLGTLDYTSCNSAGLALNSPES